MCMLVNLSETGPLSLIRATIKMGSQHDSVLVRRNEDVCQDEIKLQVCLSK